MDHDTRDDKKEEKAVYVGIPQDVFAWSLGIGFIIALLAAIMGFGRVRRWDAQSGYQHNLSETSAGRFLAEPTCEDVAIPGRCDPTASSRWYYWQLPPGEATALTRAVVWLCYIAHQLFIWATIYIAQRLRARDADSGRLDYSHAMTKYQWVPLIGNMVFHLLHLAQTHWTYDATAQDVSEASAQSSVIVVLVFILLLEYRDRGVFFGWPTCRHKDRGVSRAALRLPLGPIDLLRKYHGYAFAWGAVYTCWYHPMESTWGHCFGFIHTWMLMLQGSLMYTDFHLNRYWRLLLESWVVIHATVVAVQTGGPGGDTWAMFCFGFLWVFLMTQLFGLTMWTRLPGWMKPLPFVVYVAVCVGLYGFLFVDSEGRHWVRLNELIRIPVVEYAAMLFTWFCLWSYLKIERFIKHRWGSPDGRHPLPRATEVAYIFLCLMIYAIIVAISYLVQELDLKMELFVLMVVLIGIFTTLVLASVMFLKQIMRPPLVRNGTRGPRSGPAAATREVDSSAKTVELTVAET